ncbi:MAG TPA: methyltransferase domain-containing protein [Candidatus Acidoferrum sp.]|nr:methyltransferase domain-containing protein [Candidatus Acidoferrum sp.]
MNHRLQIWNGFYANFRWSVECNIGYLCDIIRATSKCGLQLQGARTLEVGTGWIPTLPLGMHLLGAQVHTYDHVRHLRTVNLAKLVDLYPEYLLTLAEAAQCDAALSEGSLRDFKSEGSAASLDDWFRPFGVHYHAPGDASQSGIPDSSLDLYFSVAVLEHVSKTAIKAMLGEAHRILRSGGLTYPVIGMFDRYTNVDPSITRVNFLKFNELTWRLIGQNKINYHNRLRESEFIALFEEAGFEIVDRRSEVDEPSLKALETMRLAPKYRCFDKRDLATFGGILTARKP